MSTNDNDPNCCGPDFKAANYPRGSTDKNDAMFTFERDMMDAIDRRCGKATSDQSGMADTMSKTDMGPGQKV